MVETTSASATCVNCGKPILHVTPPLGVDPSWAYWYHPDGNTRWCYNPEAPDIPLDKRHFVAEPKDE